MIQGKFDVFVRLLVCPTRRHSFRWYGQHGRVHGACFPAFDLGVEFFSCGRPPAQGHRARRLMRESCGRLPPRPVIAGRIASQFGLLCELVLIVLLRFVPPSLPEHPLECPARSCNGGSNRNWQRMATRPSCLILGCCLRILPKRDNPPNRLEGTQCMPACVAPPLHSLARSVGLFVGGM